MKYQELIEYKIFVNNEHINLLKNPSLSVLKNELKKHRFLRGYIEGNDIYWWNGHAAIHYDMARKLGFDYTDKNRLNLGLTGIIDHTPSNRNRLLQTLWIKRNTTVDDDDGWKHIRLKDWEE